MKNVSSPGSKNTGTRRSKSIASAAVATTPRRASTYTVGRAEPRGLSWTLAADWTAGTSSSPNSAASLTQRSEKDHHYAQSRGSCFFDISKMSENGNRRHNSRSFQLRRTHVRNVLFFPRLEVKSRPWQSRRIRCKQLSYELALSMTAIGYWHGRAAHSREEEP